MHKGAEITDPDEALSGPSLQSDGLSSCIPDLPVEEQGLAHHLVVSEAVRLDEAMRLQFLVGIEVLAHAQRGLHPLGVKRREGEESAKLPYVLVMSCVPGGAVC